MFNFLSRSKDSMKMDVSVNRISIEQFVESAYTGLLGRPSDTEGREFFVSALLNKTISPSDVLREFRLSAEFQHSLSGALDPVVGCSAAEAMQIFNRFGRYQGAKRDGFITNFLGGITSVDLINAGHLSGMIEGFPIPRNFHAGTLEWVAVLRSITEARDSFRMIELGAGWGPWCTVGYLAAMRLGLQPSVTAVEGDPGHIGFIRQSFADNQQDLRHCEIVHGVVGVRDGRASFPKLKKADADYGGAALFNGAPDEHYTNFVEGVASNIDKIEEVNCYGLDTLIAKAGGICDLVHCDIQGAERDVISAHVETLSSSVRRLFIGTHSFDNDRALVTLLPRYGWVCEGFDPTRMTTEGGVLKIIHDGSQVWRNSRLL